MHLAKLTTTLRAFSEPQFKRLKEYVHSPYFKIPAASVALFDYLSLFHPRYPEKKLDVELIASKHKNLNSSSAQSWAGTELLHAIEQFIGLEFYRENEAAVLLHKVHGIKNLQLHQHLNNGSSEAVHTMSQQPATSPDSFYHRHLLTELHFNLCDLHRQPGSPADITTAIDTLDEFYALKKLHYLCEAYARQQISRKAFTGSSVAALIKTLQPYCNGSYPCVFLFVNIYRMLQCTTYKQSMLYYQRVKQHVTKNADSNPPPSLEEAINYIIHHFLYWYNRGQETAGTEYLYWLELKMKYGWLLAGGVLQPVTYRNIVTIGYAHRPAEWLAQFIEQAAPHLPCEHRLTEEAFALGLLACKIGNHKSALRSFLTAQAKEQPLFNCIIRRWQWLCTFEYDRTDSHTLEQQLKAFGKYLNRNKKIIGNYEKMFGRFIHYAEQLISPLTPSQLLREIKALHREPHFAGKNWLVKQLNSQPPKGSLDAKIRIRKIKGLAV